MKKEETQSDIRVLVVDDSAIYRKILSSCFDTLPGVSVVSTAPNGRLALLKARSLQPDLITLDVEMPDMDGVETLKELQKMQLDIPVIMVSSHAVEGAAVTIAALELGAYDFVTKPEGMDLQKNIAQLSASFRELIGNLPSRKVPSRAPTALDATPAVPAAVPPAAVAAQLQAPLPTNKKVLVIGVSTGGPNALADIIPRLPAQLAVPVLIVQHMPASFTAVLADSLNNKSALEVVEAQQGDQVRRGVVYIAPGGKQMRLKGSAQDGRIELTDDAPVRHCKPAVDYLFATVAEIYGSSALALILTGMGADGTDGCRQLKAKGAHICVQSGETCVVNGMPQSALNAGVVDTVLPLDDIAPALTAVLS